MRPNVFTVRATASSTCPASPTSQARARACRPCARTSAATVSSDGSRRLQATTWAPTLASQLDGDGAPDALAGPRHDGDAVTESVGGKTHEVRAYQLPREDRSLNDRARRGHDARDLDLLAIDQGRHLGRDLVLPVVALVDDVVEALALRLALESPDPHVDALFFLAHEAAEDDHAHRDLEGDDLLLHALDPALALPRPDVILPELEEHACLPV